MFQFPTQIYTPYPQLPLLQAHPFQTYYLTSPPICFLDPTAYPPFESSPPLPEEIDNSTAGLHASHPEQRSCDPASSVGGSCGAGEAKRTPRKQKKLTPEENKQKFGRNIHSNIFHLMVKFVKRERKLRAVVARIIDSQGLLIKVSEFYALFKNKCYKLKSYANIAKIAEFWRGPSLAECQDSPKMRKEGDCAKIFRILGRLYLEKQHFPYVFNSLKIKTESKRLHMEGVRKILSLQ